ncbi:hypothetical protein OF83DRAFT_523897 [Amylostereum chailletii]|nr:hypothetical protein OF83DRAFT_523897 [Amylostereum chailletii]
MEPSRTPPARETTLYSTQELDYDFFTMMELTDRTEEAVDNRLMAERYMSEHRYDAAFYRFARGLEDLTRRRDDIYWQIPSDTTEGGVRSDAYLRFREYTRAFVEAMTCSLGAGTVCKIQGKLAESLIWLEEVRVIHKNLFLGQRTAYFDWTLYDPSDKDHWKQRILSMLTTAEIALRLGNTGLATHYTWFANRQVAAIVDEPSRDIRRYLDQLLPREAQLKKIVMHKHPDPRLSASFGVEDPGLQVMGSWEKIWIPKHAKIPSRYRSASFVWNGRFYVCGGEKSLRDEPYLRDLHYIDLESLDGWHALPFCPVSRDASNHLVGHHTFVHNDKAYVFTGRRILEVFDLRQETWSRVKTRWEGGGAWPFPANDLVDSAAVYVRGTLYVFGGATWASAVGCDMWMALDLHTGVWRRLSGRVGPGLRPDFGSPGPRKSPLLWTDGSEERIWMMYGVADRGRALLRRQECGAGAGYVYDDFWVWDIAAGTWTRRRIVGNPPCPRAEAAVVYNPVLDQTFVFGGVNILNPVTIGIDDKQPTLGSFYADTFVLEPAPEDRPDIHPVWRQVLTRGFPTYRAQPHLFVDPRTGRVFMFGGYARQHDSTKVDAASERKSFGDLWMLRVDEPGGGFEEVDLEEEARTARTGPWMRCFSCGASGVWKRCSGSCGGASFFCSPKCQKNGWKEHKDWYLCTK